MTKSKSTPKLYQYDVCPFCLKVKVALGLKGVAYEPVEVHPLNKKELGFSSDWKKVPVYIDSKGKQVNDSTVIMRHIDEEFPKRPIFEKTPEGKAREDQWLAWSEKYVKSLPPVIYDSLPNALRAFDYITRTGKFSWAQRRLVKYSGAAAMTLVARKIKKRLAIEDPQSHLSALLKEWEAGLAGQPFVGGAKPNAADAAVFGITLSYEGLPASRALRQHPVFFGWMERMAEASGIPLAPSKAQ